MFDEVNLYKIGLRKLLLLFIIFSPGLLLRADISRALRSRSTEFPYRLMSLGFPSSPASLFSLHCMAEIIMYACEYVVKAT